ncbi:MAG: polymorphic toxin-type HINT domain-containing protein [Ktedonobacterales bacterium]
MIGLASSVGMGGAVKLGGKALGRIAGRAAEAAESEVAGAAEEAESSVASSVEEGASCALSFAPDTQVATPSGERAIGTLQVGDHVTAYDPTTGKTSTQTVQHVWINHDTDLIDVTLRVADTQVAASDAKARRAAVAAHGLRAPPTDDAAELTAATTHDELIHTTAKHPWLTTDRGFVLAGTLHSGERVVREDGTPATVVAVVVRSGAADYYNLTVSVLHTYAVGSGRYVVHNCNPGETLSKYRSELQAGNKRTVAYADYNIGGEQGRIATVSGEASRSGAIGNPVRRLFTATATGDNPREFDAELKLLEHIGNKFADTPSARGTVDLFVDHDPCSSCQGVFEQFGNRFPNITLNWTWVR